MTEIELKAASGVAATADQARTAGAEEIQLLLHDGNESVLLALIENPALQEPQVALLLERLDLPAKVLGAIGEKKQWTASESVRLRLAQHPRTPKRIALAMVKQIYLMNLVRLSLLPSAPPDIRRIAEESIVARLPQLPVGQKLTLARRGPGRVAGALLAEGHPQTMKLALENPFLTESQILKILAGPSVRERAVAAVAEHAKWSRLYNIRMALVRNAHTPAGAVRGIVLELTSADLREIAKLQELTPATRSLLEQELQARRGGNREDV